MFYAMAKNKIDLRGYRFEHRLEDIQTLNERALRGELHISAVSIHAYAHVSDKYALMPCGASMGDGYGPILIGNGTKIPRMRSDDQVRNWLRSQVIAVPGRMTSAYLALQLYLGDFKHVIVPFNQIFDAVKNSLTRASVLRRLSILANGGKAKPDCRCRSVEMCCAKISRILYGTTSFRSCDKASTTALPTAVRRCATHYHTPAKWMQSSPGSLSGCMSTITPGITAMPGARRFVNSLAMHTPPDTSTIKSRLSLWNNGNSLANYFFGLSALLVCLTINAFTRAASFWNPFVKSCVPYSKSTMKQNVKKTKRASQKSPRSNPMPEIVTWANCSVNGPYLRNKLRIEPQGEAAKLFAPCGCRFSI